MNRFGIKIIFVVLGVFFTGGSAQAEYFMTDVVDAAKRGDYHAVHQLIDEDQNKVYETDTAGFTALHWAAIGGHWRIFSELVASGAPVNTVGGDGSTPLHWVSHHDRPLMIQLLLDAGADVDVQNRWGRTPLHEAARRCCSQVVRMLLERGADPNMMTYEGWTTLHVAYQAGHKEIVFLLLVHGADPGMTDSEGLRPEEKELKRPAAIKIQTAALDEYVGMYDLGEGSQAKVWLEDGTLRMREFAGDELYAIGRDLFFCRREPWMIHFLRDAVGRIESIELNNLRQTVVGIKADSPRYVGSHVCLTCHSDAERGHQNVSWMASNHVRAYWRLESDWALFLAQRLHQYQDIVDPVDDDRCLLCHTVGRQDPDSIYDVTFRPEEGVGCEACHGPGSMYANSETMSDHEAFLAAGGRVPDEKTCRSCHRDSERFDWAEMWPEIEHSLPPGKPHAG